MPASPRRGTSAQRCTTRWNAVSSRTSKAPRRSVLRRLRDTTSSRGSQHHARIGREPEQRLLDQRPREDPVRVREQQAIGRKIAADREQPRRIRLFGRREVQRVAEAVDRHRGKIATGVATSAPKSRASRRVRSWRRRGAPIRRAAATQERGILSNGTSRSTRGSRGRPSTRSATTFFWISSVPPAMCSDGAIRN